MNAVTRPTTTIPAAGNWGEFLRPLLLAVSNPPSREDYAAKCQVIAVALSHIPADMLTGWRQRDILRAFKFFPTPAELDEWFAPAVADRRQTDALKALPAPKPEPRAERTPEEIAEVRAKVQAFIAERNAVSGPADMPRVQPRYLTGEHLAEARRLAAERARA